VLLPDQNGFFSDQGTGVYKNGSHADHSIVKGELSACILDTCNLETNKYSAVFSSRGSRSGWSYRDRSGTVVSSASHKRNMGVDGLGDLDSGRRQSGGAFEHVLLNKKQ
jgi:hypothetical protein